MSQNIGLISKWYGLKAPVGWWEKGDMIGEL